MTEDHPDRFFPADPATREIARRLHAEIVDLPIAARMRLDARLFEDEAPRAAHERARLHRLELETSALDAMEGFEALRIGTWPGRVVPLYCAEPVMDPEMPGFVEALDRFGQLADTDAYTWKGYLDAHRVRREVFKVYGATDVLVQPPTARAAALDPAEATALFRKVCIGKASAVEAESFRALMLVELARMSLEDGLGLVIEPGRLALPFEAAEADFIQLPLDYVRPLRVLLQLFGAAEPMRIAVATRDVPALADQLAPLAELTSALRIGLAGGTCNAPSRLAAFREIALEHPGARTQPMKASAAGLDGIAASADTARRIDCAVLAHHVATHRIGEETARGFARHWALAT